MFKHFLKSIKSNSSEHSSSNQSQNHDKEHGLLPVKLYLGIFVALLLMIFLNIGISKLPIPGVWITVALLTVSTIQTILVALFFMELIHEDKFYYFVFGSAILFMILFFSITLLELKGRDFFHKNEGIKVLRGIDQNGNYAPGGPKFEKEQEKK
jgi:cytochrome c oxidase subunit 4